MSDDDISIVHKEGPQAYIQTIYVCPECGWKSYAQWEMLIVDYVTKQEEIYRYCPKCYMEHIKSLGLGTMVEWRGSDE